MDYGHLTTPCYVYDLELLRRTIKAVQESSKFPGFKVHYAVKANYNPVILQTISQSGIGADTVSGGEILQAINNGFKASDITFAGVGKTDDELKTALKYGIGCFNVESLEEIEVLSEIAQGMHLVAPVAIRVNPNIDAHTHSYITTGLSENKFGIDLSMLYEAIRLCRELPGIDLTGLHFHIGSQLTDMQPYELLCKTINEIQDRYSDISFRTINVGGGLGIDYNAPSANPIPDFRKYFSTFHSHLRLRSYQELHFELGRSIVGQCGTLISRVTYVKRGVNKKFIVLDAGMTDLIRPALYQAHHKIENLTSESEIYERYDVVGPVCESSDTFATDITLPITKRGDIIGIRSAGAYGESMANQYNCRRLPGSVLI